MIALQFFMSFEICIRNYILYVWIMPGMVDACIKPIIIADRRLFVHALLRINRLRLSIIVDGKMKWKTPQNAKISLREQVLWQEIATYVCVCVYRLGLACVTGRRQRGAVDGFCALSSDFRFLLVDCVQWYTVPHSRSNLKFFFVLAYISRQPFRTVCKTLMPSFYWKSCTATHFGILFATRISDICAWQAFCRHMY